MGMSRQEAGSKGGKETLKRYGRSWMQELGKRGLRATANKYFAGSLAECMSYLRKKAGELQIAALADQEGMTCVLKLRACQILSFHNRTVLHHCQIHGSHRSQAKLAPSLRIMLWYPM